MHVTIENLTINFAAEPVDTAEDTEAQNKLDTILEYTLKLYGAELAKRLEELIDNDPTADLPDTEEEGI